MQHTWNFPDKESEQKCIDELITRIEDIGDDGVGMIAAQDVIDIVTEHLAPTIYNRGVRDARKLVLDKMQDAEFELDGLQIQQ
ncbi:DUF2164 family protein [Candidatus Mycosynbacter amalyticus]|uniref:DUF2164 family protein n=1 Tax=Candidatus Mycosynbacter amalyticus TaxID=2665156 RepID=A0A857MIE6_9BACT|nr:DUF2164 domain-containing protein [Candidatus Mycosynbacter amalyticus]QHN42326.1 DUF2164 family protein [Candidatus Mycosynbacter amalyticus]